ncbi:MAG: hypothetical protein K0U84_21805 [Actinomycetia bacterium]|nr:hypothetical protein [Actinomycetes bacterium]
MHYEIRYKPAGPVGEAAACPDCDADVTLIELAPGVYSGTVAHDETCPWLDALQQRSR